MERSGRETEGYSEILQNLEPRNNSKSKQTNDRPKDGFTSTNSRAYDIFIPKKMFFAFSAVDIGPTLDVLVLFFLVAVIIF